MTKACGLDLGETWTGVALSDASMLIARPFKTIRAPDIESFLEKLFDLETISIVVVGLPRTLKGRDSLQTSKIRQQFEHLKHTFPNKQWILWDERFSSKRAEALGPGKKMAHASAAARKEEKLHVQARAAAFILDSYLSSRIKPAE